MFTLPAHYKSLLGEKETEHAIVLIKDFFQLTLSTELNLTRVTAPLFVRSGTGINELIGTVISVVLRFWVKIWIFPRTMTVFAPRTTNLIRIFRQRRLYEE